MFLSLGLIQCLSVPAGSAENTQCDPVRKLRASENPGERERNAAARLIDKSPDCASAGYAATDDLLGRGRLMTGMGETPRAAALNAARWLEASNPKSDETLARVMLVSSMLADMTRSGFIEQADPDRKLRKMVGAGFARIFVPGHHLRQAGAVARLNLKLAELSRLAKDMKLASDEEYWRRFDDAMANRCRDVPPPLESWAELHCYRVAVYELCNSLDSVGTLARERGRKFTYRDSLAHADLLLASHVRPDDFWSYCPTQWSSPLAYAHMTLCRSAQECGRNDIAIRSGGLLVSNADKFDSATAAICYERLGAVYLVTGDFPRADALLREAVAQGGDPNIIRNRLGLNAGYREFGRLLRGARQPAAPATPTPKPGRRFPFFNPKVTPAPVGT